MAYLFSSLALMVSVISFFYLRSYIIKKTDASRLPAETRAEVQQIINEIDRITDRDSALVEERVARLKELLADADRRVGLFGREVESHSRRDAAYAELGRRKKSAPRPPDEEVPLFAPDGSGALAQPAPPPDAQSTPQPPPAPETPRKDQIVLLAASGLSPAQIAVKLGMTITEVEMFLVLHTKHGA